MGIMSKEHLNVLHSAPCLDQPAEGSSEFSLSVAFVCQGPLGYVGVSQVVHAENGKAAALSSFSPSALPCDFC